MRLLPLLLAVAGCSDPRVLSIEVTPGHEADAFSIDPAITRVDVQAVGADGAVLGGAAAAPGGSFAIGELTLDTLVRLEVWGFDTDGSVAMRGRTLSVLLGGLKGDVWPVFAQRLEGWSRPPNGFTAGHVGGAGAVLGERYLVLTGGSGETGTRVDFYDLLSLQAAEGGILEFSPRTMVPSADGRAALFVGDERALWLDFDLGEAADAPLPTGLETWAAVAGGLVVTGTEATYLVGATRDEASDRVLVVEADRTLRTGKLVAPRRGAAASIVEDFGLVIAGGSSEAPGVEALAYDAEGLVLESEALDFLPDPTVGAALVGGGDPWLFGGDGEAVRRLDLEGCIDACTPEVVAIDLPVALTACRGFVLDDGFLVLGQGPDGLLTSVRIADDVAVEAPLREPRSGAVIVATPSGTLAIFGGADAAGTPLSTVETWFPTTP